MAINEKIVTGRKFRRLINKEAKLWMRMSWWHKASDCEFDDGRTAEQKLGNINGITSNLDDNYPDIAASSEGVFTIHDNLEHGIINKHIQFVIQDDGTLGWKKDGADTVIPFSSGPFSLMRNLKHFYMKSSSKGHNVNCYLKADVLPIAVWSGAHADNGFTYHGMWDLFHLNDINRNGFLGNTLSVTPLSAYTLDNNGKVNQETPAATGDTIIGWHIVGKCLDKGDTPTNGEFHCYYIDNQPNYKYEDLYGTRNFHSYEEINPSPLSIY